MKLKFLQYYEVNYHYEEEKSPFFNNFRVKSGTQRYQFLQTSILPL